MGGSGGVRENAPDLTFPPYPVNVPNRLYFLQGIQGIKLWPEPPARNWLEAPETRPTAPLRHAGKGLKVEPSAYEIERRHRERPAVFLMPHGVFQRDTVWATDHWGQSSIPENVRARMPIRLTLDEVMKMSPSDMIMDHSCILTRRGPDLVYYPPEQDQAELYAEGGPMLDWRKITDAVSRVWQSSYAPYGYVPGIARPDLFSFTGPWADPRYRGYYEESCRSLRQPGTYAFSGFEHMLVLNSEQVERAVRWTFMPETVRLG